MISYSHSKLASTKRHCVLLVLEIMCSSTKLTFVLTLCAWCVFHVFGCALCVYVSSKITHMNIMFVFNYVVIGHIVDSK